MSITNEQIRDLIFLSQNGCVGRKCEGCIWKHVNSITLFEKCLLLQYSKPTFDSSRYTPEKAKQIIRNI